MSGKVPKKRTENNANDVNPPEIRISLFLARAGIASRRQAEDIIRQGQVKVNGRVVRNPAERLNPKKDSVKVDGKRIKERRDFVYIILNKPGGVVCTMDDPQGRPAVGTLLGGLRGKPAPVGRLDFDTEGLLFCTNDGDLANQLMHPRYHVRKVYHVKVKGIPDDRIIKRLRDGVMLDGRRTLPARVSFIKKSARNSWLRMTIFEGKNRQIKRMFDKFGFTVLKLRRVSLGPLSLGQLPRGAWRKLQPEEVRKLKEYITGLDKG